MAANIERVLTSRTGAILLLACLFVFLVGLGTARGVDPMKLGDLPFIREIGGGLLMALMSDVKRQDPPKGQGV